MANRKGERRERKLVNLLGDVGFAVMRAPASGRVTERYLSDVLAGDGDSFYAIESKSSSCNPIYLDREKVEALIFYAENIGAGSQIGIRFDEEDWSFHDPNEFYVTEAGNYRLKKETAMARGADLFELAEESTQSRLHDLQLA